MEPIREILKVKVDPNRNPTHVTKTVRGDLPGFPADTTIFHPEGMMAIEDFKAGDTIRWTFPHAEFQYVLKGKAELVYILPPWYDEEKTLSMETGEACLIPNGADVTFKIAPGEPLRKLCVVMPAYMKYLETPPKNIVPL
jgi:hypothetical protein